MIEARGLARTFSTRTGPVEAVRGVDLDVADGEIVGFLGPNGAGKTTTLRMLTTLLTPTAGRATVAGCDLATDPVGVRRRIGYVAQGGVTYPEARVGEEVVDQARLYGIDKATGAERGRALFAQLDLDAELWGRNCGSLSGGQRRRLDIVMGLVHQPVLVFLDEPSTGLDPQSRANLWGHVRGLREGGTTVFLTTHYLDEADALCDRILVIDHGVIVAAGSPEELKRQVSGDAVVLTLGDAGRAADAATVLSGVNGTDEPVVDGRLVSVHVPDGGHLLPALLRDLDHKGIALDAVEVRRPTLDDVFLSLTGRSLREGND
ncbi:MAG: ATP-binding cassette domain-containing protein [Acidimicrobiales bacterium]